MSGEIEYDVTVSFKVTNVGSVEEALQTVRDILAYGTQAVRSSVVHQPVSAKDVVTVRETSLEDTINESRAERESAMLADNVWPNLR